jgi:hypothetical protein
MTGRAFACTLATANRPAANRLDDDARARLIGRLRGTIDRIAGDAPSLDADVSAGSSRHRHGTLVHGPA